MYKFFNRKQRRAIENNNDKLVIWNYITGPLFVFVGIIVIAFVLNISINYIWAEPKEINKLDQQKVVELRETNIEKYTDYNADVFGTINKKYWDDSLYIIESDKGSFTITFLKEQADIFSVEMTNKANQRALIYQRK